jgi:DNA polymerase-3 subunit epsilon
MGERLLVGFDLETTSDDPWAARIVTACLAPEGECGTSWFADPGIEIPASATAVHGITTAQARARGRTSRDVVAELAQSLRAQWASGAVVVVYNSPYDFRVLTEELSRHGLAKLELGPILDPLVLWREAERYRKGKKRLSDAVVRFGISLDNARAAMGVLRGLDPLTRWSDWSETDARTHQVLWSQAWADNFADWLRRQGGDWRSVDGGWPTASAQKPAR